jgi:hypothetical protein
MNIKEAYFKVMKEIQALKDEGVSFIWKEVELSSVLISELIVNEINTINNKSHGFFNIIKLKLFAFRQNFKFKKKQKNLKSTKTVLIFFNSLNQWENIEPIWRELLERNVGVHVISTKLNLLSMLPNKVDSTELTFGFDFFVEHLKFKHKTNSILNLINNNLPKLSYLHHKFNSILFSQPFKYIIVGNDNTSEGRLLATLALQRKMRVGSIQHGSINRVNPLHGISLSDDFFVFGEKPAQELSYLGKRHESIFVSGWPMQKAFKNELLVLRAKNNPHIKSDILVCLSGLGHSIGREQHIETLNLIAKLQTELNLNIIVKLHPKDNFKYFEYLDEERTLIFDNNSLSEIGSSLLELFLQAKCTITIASTAALESLLAETPVITIDLPNSNTEIDFIQDGLTFHATNYEELRKHYLSISNSRKGQFSMELKAKIEKYYFNYFTEGFTPAKKITEQILNKCTETLS